MALGSLVGFLSFFLGQMRGEVEVGFVVVGVVVVGGEDQKEEEEEGRCPNPCPCLALPPSFLTTDTEINSTIKSRNPKFRQPKKKKQARRNIMEARRVSFSS